MTAIVETPRELLEAVADLRLPAKADGHLQALMERNNEGALNSEELGELEALVELSETIGLVRAKALHVLGRKPT